MKAYQPAFGGSGKDSRAQKLLSAKTSPMKIDPSVQNSLADKMRPKTDDDYKGVFWQWMGAFHRRYLTSEYSSCASELFVIKPVAWQEHMNADISGDTIKAIMDSSEVLKLNEVQA